jgi:TFIIF-interacting CTD phosphatase-like protein
MEIYPCSNYRKPTSTLTPFTLVLDIDETLVRTFDDLDDLKSSKIFRSSSFYPVRSQLYLLSFDDDEDDEKLWGIKRPYLNEFLEFAFTYFKNVVVWSAGQEDYVHEMCKHIFKNFPCPDLIMTRKHCDYNEKDNSLFKPLTKLYQLLPDANQSYTIMIDDRDDVMSKNLNNGIVIPPYTPSLQNLSSIQKDDNLLKLINWFSSQHIMTSQDLQNLNKNNIF